MAKRWVRRIGDHGCYWQQADGRYFTINPQHGFVEVRPDCSRALRSAIRAALSQMEG